MGHQICLKNFWDQDNPSQMEYVRWTSSLLCQYKDEDGGNFLKCNVEAMKLKRENGLLTIESWMKSVKIYSQIYIYMEN